MDKKTRTPKPLSALSRFYLIAYNLISALGWMYVFGLTVQIALSWKSYSDLLVAKNLYAVTRLPLKILLASSALEILHAAFKLVPSNPVIVFVQVFVRFIVVWGICDTFTASNRSFAIFMLNTAWSISEITRYSYYAFNLLNLDPYPVKWARYSFFIILYPIGAFAEMLCFVFAAFYIQPTNIRNQYSLLLPNKLNIAYDLYYVFWATTFLYIPGFPVMYKHMLAQRRKYLSKPKAN